MPKKQVFPSFFGLSKVVFIHKDKIESLEKMTVHRIYVKNLMNRKNVVILMFFVKKTEKVTNC